MTLAEIQEDAESRAARQASKRQQLEARFRELAEGKPWFDGIFPHQWTAMCFGAVARRWLLGDEPGLGKTRASIGWLDLVGANRVVLVAEANVASQFAGEMMDLAPHRTIIVLTGSNGETRRERTKALLTFYRQAVVVVNYEMFRRDPESLENLLSWHADTVIVDEAHNLKSISTSNFKMVQKLLFTDNKCEQCGSLVRSIRTACKVCGHFDMEHRGTSLKRYLATKSVMNVCLMTGTPLLNTPLDLYALFHLIDPAKFPSEAAFKKAFLKPSFVQGSRKHTFKRDGMKNLEPFIKNFYIARKLDEVGVREEGGVRLPNGAFLPDQQQHIVRVDLDQHKYPLQYRTIRQVSDSARIILESGARVTLMHMITIILRERQANVWPGGIVIRDPDTEEVILRVGDEVQESCKMDACLEQLQAYHAEGHRQIVFSQFKTALEEFEQRCNDAGLRAVRFDGDTPTALRNEIKANFYRAKAETPKWDVVLVHYRTGGAGLNLTAATVTHCLDEEWNAGKRDQSFGRTHRIGQTEPTYVLTYRIPGTIDTWMANLIAHKEKMANSLREMSNKELIMSVGTAIKEGKI